VLVGVVGEDETGRVLMREFAKEPRVESEIVLGPPPPDTRKVRFVSEHHSTHLLRADWESSGPVEAGLEKSLIDRIRAALPHVRAMVLSDYAKGVLTPSVIGAAFDAAHKQGVPVIVDPKGVDYSIYRARRWSHQTARSYPRRRTSRSAAAPSSRRRPPL